MNKALPVLLATTATFAAPPQGASRPPDAPSPRASAPAGDPVVTDGDKYHVVLENDHVRVLRYHDEPGQRTHLHHHPSFVLYALSPFKRQLTGPDGKTRQRTFKAGEAVWVAGESHVGENIGDLPTDVLIVELKSPP